MAPADADDLFADAVVRAIRTEMRVQRVRSVRALAEMSGLRIGAVRARMNGNVRTGQKVPVNVRDLAAIAAALGTSPSALLVRAEAILAQETSAGPR